MPRAAFKPCSHPGCRALVSQGRCPKHARVYHEQRREAGALYWTPSWRRFSRDYLRTHPVCAAQDCAAPSTHTDHVTPHHGDPVRFWAGPFQALCASHHSSKTSSEDGGFGNQATGGMRFFGTQKNNNGVTQATSLAGYGSERYAKVPHG